MPNPEGSFIWYELMTPDPDASKAFYDAVVGWNIEAVSSVPGGAVDYRMITRSDGGNIIATYRPVGPVENGSYVTGEPSEREQARQAAMAEGGW